MFLNALKFTGIASMFLLLTGCSSNARFHELQSARLTECNYLADKEYHACVKRQQDSYENFKKQKSEQ
ncbi:MULTISPECIES: hypothetical protein [Pseudoalteromonas]|uniref:hypothetical protein n=1 Tax=Pseudoalteromonas TaxID=53246 RepID=UPI000782D654|nr:MULTISPECIES: hypothetical protein [Pseudoalteromonas]MCF7517952.1 hypothetical protein [Pseudoalteromonas sp. L21]UJX27847.1 hypothetical protein L3Q70_18120 [Pseudoalteromonas sp. CF6-2]|tara:strand:+ start:1222 stop:1425 length:204 start_codon:yes stop_codon:yes gene_type:complete